MTKEQKIEKCRKKGYHMWRTCGRDKDKRVCICDVCEKPLIERIENMVSRRFV